jgi:hypothetical protein
MVPDSTNPHDDFAQKLHASTDIEPPRVLIGRKADEASLRSHLLARNEPIRYVVGPPGCGKTELVRKITWDIRTRFDQVGWLDLTHITEVTYQLIPNVPIGSWSATYTDVSSATVSGAALAETLLPAMMARTATGTRTTRRKREKRRMLVEAPGLVNFGSTLRACDW